MSSSLNRITEVVKKIRGIQNKSENKGSESAKYITDSCNRIANDENKRLNVEVDNQTGELLSEPACSYHYYSELMVGYRNGIKALNFKHHAIERNVNAFIRKYRAKKSELTEKLNPSLSIQKLRDNIVLLRSKTVSGSEFRKDLLSLKIEHHAYYRFEPKGVMKDWIRDDSSKQLNKKLHSQILVNPNWVKSKITELLSKQNPSVSDLCIGIALATGRRLTEIMKTAKISRMDDETLLFSGQLKTKNRHLFEEIAPYEIPTMIKAELVVKSLKVLRKKTKNDSLNYLNVLGEEVQSTVGSGVVKDYYHNKSVKKRYEGSVNQAIRSLLQNGNFSLKDCRGMYTEITYQDHCREGEAKSAYRHRVLGHSLIETQLHYETFQLDDKITSVKLIEDDENKEIDDTHESLIEYLEQFDNEIIGYARAPKLAVMHQWLKDQVKDGLKYELISPSYIRRHCLIEGKQLNLNTIKKYTEEFIFLDKFELPKAKPKTRKEKELIELQEQLEKLERHADSFTDDIDNLKNEKEDIKSRLPEIDEELELIEEHAEELSSDIDELRIQIEDLESESDEVEQDEQDEPSEDLEWPLPTDIKVSAKKQDKLWHCSATVNGEYFEIMVGGLKKAAIESLRSHYKETIKTKS